MEYIYLHGWLSGPLSNKARYFKEKFQSCGISLVVPDFNMNDFYNLTLTRQINQVRGMLPEKPVTLIGSSFGALTALWAAENSAQIERLVLMAPAFSFYQTAIKNILTEEQMILWKNRGEIELEHFAYPEKMPLSYNFIRDIDLYRDLSLKREVQTFILHGVHDEVIPVKLSREFASERPWIELAELDGDHALGGVQDQLWEKIKHFCKID